MAEEKTDHTDRFGWHPDQAVVTLVPGVAELPDEPTPKKAPPKKTKRKDAEK